MSDNSKVAPLDIGPIRGQLVDGGGAVKFDPDAPPGVLELGLVRLRQWVSGRFGARLQSTGGAADPAQTRVICEVHDVSPANPYLVYFDQLILTTFTGPGKFDLLERDLTDLDIGFLDCITVSSSPLLTSVGDNFTADMVGDFVTMVGVTAGTKVLSYQNPKQVTLSSNATANAPSPGIYCTLGGKSEVTLATKAGFTNGATTGGWSRLVRLITSEKYYRIVFVPGDAGDGVYTMGLSGLSQGFSVGL